jgi:hypothetical protein
MMDGLRSYMPEPGIDGVDGPHKPGLRMEVTDAPNATLGGHLSSWEEERHGGHGGHGGGTTTAQASETTAIYDDHPGGVDASGSVDYDRAGGRRADRRDPGRGRAADLAALEMSRHLPAAFQAGHHVGRGLL